MRSLLGWLAAAAILLGAVWGNCRAEEALAALRCSVFGGDAIAVFARDAR